MKYRQCMLVKTVASGLLKDVAYIPLENAKVGNVLAIERDDGSLDDGWRVTAVYGVKESDELDSQRKAQKRWESVVK